MQPGINPEGKPAQTQRIQLVMKANIPGVPTMSDNGIVKQE